MITVPCVSPDGKPTQSGLATLNVVKGGAVTPRDVADATGQPMFRVRSGLRDLVNAGFLDLSEDKYSLTSEGEHVLSN